MHAPLKGEGHDQLIPAAQQSSRIRVKSRRKIACTDLGPHEIEPPLPSYYLELRGALQLGVFAATLLRFLVASARIKEAPVFPMQHPQRSFRNSSSGQLRSMRPLVCATGNFVNIPEDDMKNVNRVAMAIENVRRRGDESIKKIAEWVQIHHTET
jgi:hypothetical protein